jgi:hypothetical protein
MREPIAETGMSDRLGVPGRRWYAPNATGDHPAHRPSVDVTVPVVPRVYDALLGGKDNFAADTAMAERLAETAPVLRAAAKANRAFRTTAVRLLAGHGIDQIIDIGCGLPDGDSRTGGVHHLARQAGRAARVVYVDRDPLVLSHVRALHGGDEGVSVVDGDLRDPVAILTAPQIAALDLSRPVGLILAAVLHFLPDDSEAHRVVSVLRGALAPGSFLVVTHAEQRHDPQLTEAAELYAAEVGPFCLRTVEQLTGFFHGWELLAPGIVPVTAWPTSVPDVIGPSVPVLAAIARKPQGMR